MEFCVVLSLCGVLPGVLVVSLDAQSTLSVCEASGMLPPSDVRRVCGGVGWTLRVRSAASGFLEQCFHVHVGCLTINTQGPLLRFLFSAVHGVWRVLGSSFVSGSRGLWTFATMVSRI